MNIEKINCLTDSLTLNILIFKMYENKKTVNHRRGQIKYKQIEKETFT